MTSTLSNDPDMPSEPDGPLAAIDMGSNSFRLELAQVQQGRYRRLDYLKETVRLGGGLTRDGMLTEEAMQRGLTCLERFAGRLRGFSPLRVRAVATQTLREAQNRNAFLARAEQALGFPIEVISGREEARLIFAGVARLQPSELPRLVIDIGGRSTEMILGRGARSLQAESFQIGSVSLSMKYFADGQLTESAFRHAQIAAGAELEEALVPFAPVHWKEALGSSGTVGALSQVLQAHGITDGRITPASLQWVIRQCLKAGHVSKLEFSGLKEDRRAVIAGGVSILYTLTSQFGIDELLPARGALRQGVIFDLNERLAAEGRPQDVQDIRDASVGDLQSRFGIDVPQAQRVMAVAGALHAQLEPGNPPSRAVNEARRELLWAAALHEIGMMISHHDHHRHSAYVMTNVDAPGFSQSQQRRLGMLLLAQRGGLRKVETGLADAVAARQVLCLRLAVIICHARSDLRQQALRLQAPPNEATVQIRYPGDWVPVHPRTWHLLNEEVSAWSRTQALHLELVEKP
ncbi:MAG: exopolyphosphatase [Pseudomonadota bacterium]